AAFLVALESTWALRPTIPSDEACGCQSMGILRFAIATMTQICCICKAVPSSGLTCCAGWTPIGAMTKRALLLSVTLVLGCVEQNIVEIKPGATSIKVVKEDDKPFRCDVLGDVHGTSRSDDKDKARQGAENDIKNQAATFKGANYVLLEIDRNK